MKRHFGLLALLVMLVASGGAIQAQTRFTVSEKEVVFTDGTDTLRTPAEGLWSVATGWKDDWMSDWKHAAPSSVKTTGKWTVVSPQNQHTNFAQHGGVVDSIRMRGGYVES